MKKQTLLILGAFLLMLNVSAQKNNSKNLLTVSFGPSIPIGNYANTNLSNDDAGFAKTGETINICFEHKLNKHFGIAAMMYGQKNVINTAAMAQQFGQLQFMEPYAGPGQQPPTTTYVRYPDWSFDKNNYYLGSFLIGATNEFAIGKTDKLSFVAKAMIGAVNATSPQLKGQSITDTAGAFVNQNKVSGWGLSYLINAGLKYRLNNKWSLLFSTEYVGTNSIQFKNETESLINFKGSMIQTSNGYVPGSSGTTFGIESTTVTGHQTFQSININLGIGLCF
jgi:hypothetical protein